MSMFCGDLASDWNGFHHREITFWPLVTIGSPTLETGQLQAGQQLFISRNHLNEYEKSFALKTDNNLF
ncbi:hypothetical protein TNCV_3044001 [Trichonephila clavipes]|nr:hypothetical protein TNCV_3044001 [Trichonephila clavipes]